jgi:hypothetical protein
MVWNQRCRNIIGIPKQEDDLKHKLEIVPHGGNFSRRTGNQDMLQNCPKNLPEQTQPLGTIHYILLELGKLDSRQNATPVHPSNPDRAKQTQ